MEEPVTAGLRDLMTEVATHQKDFFERRSSLSELRVRAPVRAVARTRPAVRRALILAPAFGVAVLTVAAGLWWAKGPQPITFAAAGGRLGDTLVARAGALTLDFSDGSTIELAPGAAARVAALDAAGARVDLEDGRAEVSVRHRAHTRWMLEAGPFEVRVTGTRFAITWNRIAESLVVAMTEGSVEIASRLEPGAAAVRVTAGQRFVASKQGGGWTIHPFDSRANLSSSSDAPGLAPGLAAPVPANAAPVEGTAPVAALAAHEGAGAAGASVGRSTSARLFASGGRRWQILARRGQFKDALDAVEQGPGFAATCRQLGAEELVQLGDVARLAGSVGRAEQAYTLARRRYPRLDRPVFGLGLVAFEQRHDYVAAAGWFEAYRRRFPAGPLRDEATGRAMESWQRAGDRGRAAAAAAEYLDRAPTGAYAPLARQIANP